MVSIGIAFRQQGIRAFGESQLLAFDLTPRARRRSLSSRGNSSSGN
jgi:hypothetical protein